MNELEQLNEVESSNSFFLSIVIAIIILLMSTVLMYRKSLFTSSKRTFILCGPKGSGKTNLYSLLTTGKLPKLTVSSLEPQTADIKLDPELSEHKTFHDVSIVDFPASSKLKTLFLYPYLNNKMSEIQGIIYVVDSSIFDIKYCHDVAEDLLNLLAITERKPNGIDIIIYCNKSDYFTSKKSNKVKELLQSEISKLYSIKLKSLGKVSKTLGDDDTETDVQDVLNTSFKGGNFEFQLLEGNVDFLEGNIFKSHSEDIMNWIYEKIVN